MLPRVRPSGSMDGGNVSLASMQPMQWATVPTSHAMPMQLVQVGALRAHGVWGIRVPSKSIVV